MLLNIVTALVIQLPKLIDLTNLSIIILFFFFFFEGIFVYHHSVLIIIN